MTAAQKVGTRAKRLGSLATGLPIIARRDHPLGIQRGRWTTVVLLSPNG
ncbi:hypothetical protein [Stackebrandtia soli]